MEVVHVVLDGAEQRIRVEVSEEPLLPRDAPDPVTVAGPAQQAVAAQRRDVGAASLSANVFETSFLRKYSPCPV